MCDKYTNKIPQQMCEYYYANVIDNFILNIA